ncbi:EAL domain-containing protein [Parvibaculum sp.]|uniref:EAL domain-containing protein n=1 Tax=Parvibaculum sp. TaxID=2024848 RepID=UPI003BABDFCF
MYSSSFRLTNRDIDLAFEAGHLFIVCQPKLSLAEDGVLGAEAYVRWNHPDYGLLPPGLFLSFFEQRERAGELTRFVARAAANLLVDWASADRHWPLSINLGASDLADMGLPGALDEIMGERGLDPALLMLEVPEGAFARHGEEAARVLATLRRLGFRTALDGGGAVIVPDDLLTPDHFDEVKIGGASIIQFARRLKGSGLGFVGKRVSLAVSRGLGATAVGVEDEITLNALPALGFTAAQGSLLCRPMMPDEFAQWSPVPLNLAPEEEEPEEEILLLLDPLPEDDIPRQEEAYTDETPASAAPAPEHSVVEYSVVEYSWEDIDSMIPAEEVRGVAWRLDRTCLFPDRHLLALVRRPRVLPHMKKEKAKAPVQKKPVVKSVARGQSVTHRKSKRPPANLVTRPSLVQLALGF